MLSSSEDGSVKVYDRQFIEVSGINRRYGGFNDFEWYPWMNWEEGKNCCFVSVSKNLPIEFWTIKSDNSETSTEPLVRSSWTAKDHLDQISTCYSVSISPEGQYVVAGGQASLWCFDITRPGGESLIARSTASSRKRKDGQTGVISNICFRKDSSNVFSACSFDGTIGIYDLRSIQHSSEEKIDSCGIFKTHKYGASQSKFLNDGWSLVTVGRKENILKIWDLRKLGQGEVFPVTSILLEGYNNNQRIYFDSSKDDSVIAGSGAALYRFRNSNREILTRADSTISSVTVASDDGAIAYSEGSRTNRFYIDSDSEDLLNEDKICKSSKISLLLARD